MKHSISIDVATPPERVWQVLTTVDEWPRWTASVDQVEWLDAGGPLALGSRVRISQPRLPATDYTITAIVPGRSFTWTATAPGVRMSADHVLEPLAAGGTCVQLSVTQTGWLGAILGRLYGSLTARYLALEANGLKAASEQA